MTMPTRPCTLIDVSHHQNVALFDWRRRPKDLTAAYVRGSYGARPDRETEDFCQEFWRHDLDTGLYFFIRDEETLDQQWAAIQKVVDEYSYSEAPAIALDFEGQVTKLPKGKRSRNPDPAKFVPLCDELLRRAEDTYGAVIVYTNSPFWVAMGSPKSWLAHPWWLANYSAASVPLLPNGRNPTIWQHSVGPIPGFYPNEIDQNLTFGRLPRHL